jgi:Zn-dependent M28 family amino/carboxypeptidase
MGYPDTGGYCLGSRHYASGPLAQGAKPKFGIILDMVCDPGGIYYVEKNSLSAAPAVVEAVWKAGQEKAPGAFNSEPYLTIIDDHVPLTQAGVPSILVIGFNYPQWHTTDDTLKHCSAKRLGQVEGTLEEVLRGAVCR